MLSTIEVGASKATTRILPVWPACWTPLPAPSAEKRLAPKTPLRSELRAKTACSWLAALLASLSLNWVSSTSTFGKLSAISALKPSSRWSVVEMPGLTFET